MLLNDSRKTAGKVDMETKINLSQWLKSSIQIGFSSAFILGMVACGESTPSNLEKYSNIKKNMGPVHSQQAPIQNYPASDLYLIDLDPTTPPIFILGRRNVLRFRTALNLPGTQYRLVSHDLPRGAEALKDLGNGVWELAWTPSRDLIPQGSNSQPIFSFTLSLEVLKVTNPQSENILATLSTERKFHYTVARSVDAPEITEIKGVAPYPEVTKVNEGEIVDLLITVKDPASTATQKPRLIPLARTNKVTTEQVIVSGHGFLILEEEPVMIKPDVWQFKASFDTKNNPIPEFNLNGTPIINPVITANLAFQILSPNNTISPEKNLTFEITYRRELLKPAFKTENPGHQILQQGTNWKFEFESYMPSTIGSLATFLNEETTKLPGTPTLDCDMGRKMSHRQWCTLHWKIPCDLPAGDVTIKINSAAEYEGQNSSGELQKTLTIQEGTRCSNSKSSSKSETKTGGIPKQAHAGGKRTKSSGGAK